MHSISSSHLFAKLSCRDNQSWVLGSREVRSVQHKAIIKELMRAHKCLLSMQQTPSMIHAASENLHVAA